MSANKKPRKKYRPKPVAKDPLSYVLTGIRPPSQAHLTRVAIVNNMSMTSLVQGNGTRGDWDDLCGMLNISMALCSLGVNAEDEPQIKEAILAHAECGRRFNRLGKFGFSGPEMQVVNRAILIHEEQLTKATVVDIERAIRLVNLAHIRGDFYATVTKDANNDNDQQLSKHGHAATTEDGHPPVGGKHASAAG